MEELDKPARGKWDRSLGQYFAPPSRVVKDAIGALLMADDVDRAALAKLATRQHYADAAAELLSFVRPQGTLQGVTLVGSLFRPPVARCYVFRVACHMGATKRNDTARLPELTLDEVRRIAQHGKPPKAARAKVALAILGDPCAPFAELSKRERAGLLLGLLIAAWRERAS